jgi:hypothetical protein
MNLSPLPSARATALLASIVSAACSDASSGPKLEPVTAGTISGIAFRVTGGAIYQATPGGPLYADAGGGRILIDGTPASLGMSDPDQLHLRTQFALSASGALRIVAFGDAGNEFGSGLEVRLRRARSEILYEMRLGGSLFIDSIFVPAPAIPSAETWVVTEFYADEVPGYGGGKSGITMWPLDDTTPTRGEDVLGCTAGPAIAVGRTFAGKTIGYELVAGWIVEVDVVDQIVGPCV